MKRFLIATTMLVAASSAWADDPVQTTDDETLGQALTDTYDNADLDRSPYTDDHAWIETSVYGSDGAELGEVERVRLSADGEVEAIVVEHGGTLDIGGREVLIEAGDYMVATVEGENRLELTYSLAEFEALPDFNEDAASEYPLSDDDYNDDEMDDEIETGMTDKPETGDVAMTAVEFEPDAETGVVADSRIVEVDHSGDLAMTDGAGMSDGSDLGDSITETVDNADLDRSPYTDDHAWIETSVYGADGSDLGEVERVRLTAEGEVEAIVVEHGGTLDIGGREVLIEAGDYMVAEVDGETRLELGYTLAEFEALPDFNEDAASEYPLSDDDYNDDETDEETETDNSGS
ncbi:PRC-barrel domain-containing protein [Hyphobacterium marinum]|uniref:PRC-barrel domain-containing protein n=1 Tax=Hyphobacterium marinum TaxID=3116574 RepID=A0ABU7M1K9_9PROT|nr:PRC-barrel domain-containing protein [Hyphobacterium sp. Y6023]MEE2567709.1 PRC-barrel domain-containing protein [Hyphobacterium sp. Y6023]